MLQVEEKIKNLEIKKSEVANRIKYLQSEFEEYNMEISKYP